MDDQPRENPPPCNPFAVWRWPRRVWMVVGALSPVWYFLSSGPVLASAFRLRDATGFDGFYAVILIYAPITCLLPRPIWDPYITWWCRLFHTVGPG
jgi:hypothetical protein